ncbi:hypothetical protein PHLGIDRAFT_483806 [Phlebiopsis gigantea 11061_1 CR5-6]|uniref:Uncharacterized protein n=1 Tax=Phlebiopsis gigantea (strain 11061_1 CR5-6) TaxID=745531 RepID=A0A0C3RWE0_PHLG1|nr:hypothetical protein PHLGIDRAFT_483806 [Phlebiopsis gigantea 11061_1 CR5-6]
MIRYSKIYANDFDYETCLSPLLSKINNFTDKLTFAKTFDLPFLDNYTSPITNATAQIKSVTPSGMAAAKALAGVFSKTYGDLFDTSSGSFNIWSASATRDVEMTEAFISALPNSENVSMAGTYEGDEASANTLTQHTSYPRFDSAMGSVQSGAWYDRYTAPTIARFEEGVPGFNFTIDDIVGVQQLCGYDTVIRNKADFCNVFTPEEWLSFWSMGMISCIFTALGRYHLTIALLHLYCHLKHCLAMVIPSPLSSACHGSAARLTFCTRMGQRFNTHSPFNQSLHLSFSHREQPPLVLTALGLFNNSAYYPRLNVNNTMPSDEINYGRA